MPEGSTSTNISSSLPLIQSDDAKMDVPFYTFSYILTLIKIHSGSEKYALNKRNAAQILCFGYLRKMSNLKENHAPERNFDPNKGGCIVLEVPLGNLPTRMCDFVPCDRVVQRAFFGS